ncbi:MAG: thiamine diphosphokinase [Actinomycetaceae bacterium]|nr:thiamine diphosphokinase [Actinomycetaceae bacterium]
MKVSIVLAGESSCTSEELCDYDAIIAVDGGLEKVHRCGVAPDLIVGDFDSVSSDLLEMYRRLGIEEKKFSPIKNETDGELACDSAIEYGASQIDFFGARGGRYDHEIANFALMYRCYRKGVASSMKDGQLVISCLLPGQHEYACVAGDLFSLIALYEPVANLCIRGAEYNVSNYILEPWSSRGISNTAQNEYVVLSHDEGPLFVFNGLELEKR